MFIGINASIITFILQVSSLHVLVHFFFIFYYVLMLFFSFIFKCFFH